MHFSFSKIDNLIKYRTYTISKMPITEEATLTVPDAPRKKNVSNNVRGVTRMIMQNWVDGKGLRGEHLSEMQNWIFQFYNISGNFPNLEDVNHQIDIMKNFH